MIYRIDVRVKAVAGKQEHDPVGEALRHQIAEFGGDVGPIQTARIFLLDTDASEAQVRQIATELLADPVVEQAELITTAPGDAAVSRVEVHLKPGVMDPVAASTEMAIRDMKLNVREVRTGRAFLFAGSVGKAQLEKIAGRVLANGVIESVHFDAFIPAKFETGHEYKFRLTRVPLRNLSDEQLLKLSREAHLFLSLAEMKAIQDYFRKQDREPTDIEVETLAQTWSEHCVHKTLKSAVEVCDPSGKVLRKYGNLIRDTIFDSTMALMKQEKEPFCLSVFKDNAGVVAFDDTDAVCFKVETHNHPSAIEPYGGSATGAGGVIRDVLGTGLAAKPVANTDIFCVAFPDIDKNGTALPKGVIHPKRILQQVVAGVRDYGNRMGIPTINGAVYFDDRYLGNPLVFCGCVGLIPRDKISKAAQAGDAIVVMGGRTGRDGIHGATFSSAQLTDTHADEFSHAVQIGNAITEKKVTDVVLQARDRKLFTGITDCGAGGLSSAVGEMGEDTGAQVELEKVPLKYAGLSYAEIWISEAQERMVLSVPQDKVKDVLDLAAGEDVEATVIGTFGTPQGQLILNYRGTEVGRLSMHFLHKGIPMPTRKAVVVPGDDTRSTVVPAAGALKDRLLATLAHPNIASKHWIIRQYDHEVQGGSVVKPLIGPRQVGPSDASVLRPKLSSFRGVAIGCGLAPQVNDPYAMAIAAIDEAIRNVVAIGADPRRTAILDNFCWPSVDDELTMGSLVRACEACRDAALTYQVPFISGKDSLHNQFADQDTGKVIRIPNTLLISAMAVLEDVRRCLTMDLKRAGSIVALVQASGNELSQLAALHHAMPAALQAARTLACHDVSDGGILVAAAEMSIASGIGLAIKHLPVDALAEGNGMYLVELADAAALSAMEKSLDRAGRVTAIGQTTLEGRLTASGLDVSIADLTSAWRGTLDW